MKKIPIYKEEYKKTACTVRRIFYILLYRPELCTAAFTGLWLL